MSSSTSTSVDGLLLYGVRRLRPGAKALFQRDFQAWIAKNRERLVTALAFPDPSEDCLLHLVFWERGAGSSCNDEKGGLGYSCVLEFGSEAFADIAEHKSSCTNGICEGEFHIYGPECFPVTLQKRVDPSAVGKVHFHTSLAGYMRKGPHADTASSANKVATESLPMIGIFRRAVLPGRREALATSFQPVCDIWHERVPGILAAMVVLDDDANFVQDVRVFANKDSYDAHVDKSNPELTAAMKTWFSHYDTSIPHTGIMVAEDTTDPAMRTSSIKDRPVKVDFNTFHYGQDGCMGSCLGIDYFLAPAES